MSIGVGSTVCASTDRLEVLVKDMIWLPLESSVLPPELSLSYFENCAAEMVIVMESDKSSRKDGVPNFMEGLLPKSVPRVKVDDPSVV